MHSTAFFLKKYAKYKTKSGPTLPQTFRKWELRALATNSFEKIC
jgi:hypothetical protein